MRRILIVSMLLVPMLFAAQAVASPPDSDVDASTQILRTSAGVNAPDFVYSTSVDALPNGIAFPYSAKVVLSYQVDDQGNATDFQVMNPTNPILDEHVIHAVSRVSFQPSALDNGPMPVDMTWVVAIDR